MLNLNEKLLVFDNGLHDKVTELIKLLILSQEPEKQNDRICVFGKREEDAIEFMLAGATGVQVGAANLVNPYACKEIIENLPAVMEKYGIEKLSDIIGGAH